MLDFVRLYLGELTGLFVFLVTLFFISVATIQLVPEEDKRLFRQIRNGIIVFIMVVFALGVIPSLVTNNTPRGKINRTGVDKDQQRFEQNNTPSTDKK